MTRGGPATMGPRILPVVMIGLALLGVAKAADLWIGFSSAVAEETPPSAPPASQSVPAAVAPSDPIDVHLAKRRADLDQRETAIETREALLKAAEVQIEKKLVELDAREKGAAILENQKAAEKATQISKLSDAYERMKPRDAARIFEALDVELLGQVAGGMRTQSLASVLGEMEPGKAKELTELLAQRRAVEEAPQP